MKKFLSLVFIMGLVMLLFVQEAWGFPTGIFGYSGKTGNTCNICHSGGEVPAVTLAGPAVVTPGQTAVYSLVIAGGQEAGGGLDVAVEDDGGFLTAVFTDTKLLNDELTHTAPKPAAADGTVTFTFQWTAPLTAGIVTMYGAGNSVDLDGTNDGDAPNTTTLDILVINLDERSYLPLLRKP